MILFQAQIEEHQKLAEHYRDLAAKREALAAGLLAFQQQADSDLSSLRLLVDKCKEVAPNAIALSRPGRCARITSVGHPGAVKSDFDNEEGVPGCCRHAETIRIL